MDKDLIKGIKGGDEKAFAQLYDSYADYALRTATVITGNKTVAADAVQETFIRIFRSVDSFDASKPFKPWFYRVLVNECNRLLKHRSKAVFLEDYLEKGVQPAKADDYHFEEYEELYRAITELPDINRIPVVLKYLHDFSEKEIADILYTNVNTVKSRLLRGRQKLKDRLERAGGKEIKHG